MVESLRQHAAASSLTRPDRRVPWAACLPVSQALAGKQPVAPRPTSSSVCQATGERALRRDRWSRPSFGCALHLFRAVALVTFLCFSGSVRADDPPAPAANQPLSMGLPDGLTAGPKAWTSPEGLSSSLQVMLLLTVLSLAPAALLMTTCFVRIVVVLSLLRQAIGTQNLPPTQVITTLALFLTLLIMSPVWKQVYDDAVVPYTQHQISTEQAWNAGVAPIRRFMSMQIEHTKNTEDVWLFMRYLPNRTTPKSYDDVPLPALLPAFMLSELKTAFLIGFQIYLPFVILDMVVASVMVSMGMLMLPPVL